MKKSDINIEVAEEALLRHELDYARTELSHALSLKTLDALFFTPGFLDEKIAEARARIAELEAKLAALEGGSQ